MTRYICKIDFSFDINVTRVCYTNLCKKAQSRTLNQDIKIRASVAHLVIAPRLSLISKY